MIRIRKMKIVAAGGDILYCKTTRQLAYAGSWLPLPASVRAVFGCHGFGVAHR